ncbi:MAG: hypothetical protein C0478_02365 [Planctomyces sp.]|nr:hypothetical protein [Planctomyces sp.]
MIAQGNYRSRVEKNLEIAHSESEVGMHATRAIIAAIRTKNYKELADAALTDSRNDHWEHKSIVLKEQGPTIELSALITLDEYKSSTTPLVAINIFPQEGEVIVLFSFTKEHEHHARHWCSKITEQCGDYQKYLISRMVLQHAENFVISPTYFDRMTESKKALLQQFFMMNLFNNDDTFDHPDLYLF